MYIVNGKVVGCEKVWEVISEKLNTVVFKSNDPSIARKHRERLIEDCIQRAQYLPDTMKLITFVWSRRKSNTYLKLNVSKDNNEKIYMVNPHCNTDEERAEMIGDGIELALLYDIIRDYLK